MRKIIKTRILLIFILLLFIVLSAGCAEDATDQVLEQYDKTVGEANRVSVDSNLMAINGSIRIYLASNAESPSVDDLEKSGLMAAWPTGPNGVTYELSEAAGKTVAVANKNSAGSWWTASDSRVTYPVEW